jgi:tetratricopeptide (TPR) repeat protein
MMETLERSVSDLRKTGRIRQFRQAFLPVPFILILAGMVATGCGPRITRIEVPEEDLIQANKLAQEGSDAYGRKDFYAALVKFLTASQLNPNSEHLCNRLGMAYLQLKYFDKAVETFNRSIALNSKNPYSFNNLGAAYFASGNYKKAQKYFKKAIRMKGDDATFYMNLGKLYFEKKKPDMAIAAWRKSLALDPDILNKNSSVSLSIGGEDIALKDRNYFMARVYAASGNIPKAIESLEDAIMNGFTDIELIQKNPEFNGIRKDKRFVEFMKSAAVWKGLNQPVAQ